jgi:hypothetical protein
MLIMEIPSTPDIEQKACETTNGIPAPEHPEVAWHPRIFDPRWKLYDCKVVETVPFSNAFPGLPGVCARLQLSEWRSTRYYFWDTIGTLQCACDDVDATIFAPPSLSSVEGEISSLMPPRPTVSAKDRAKRKQVFTGGFHSLENMINRWELRRNKN